MRRITKRLLNVKESIMRYPFLLVLLFTFVVVNGITIEENRWNYSELQQTLFIAIALNIVAQQIYERFYQSIKARIGLYAIGLALAIGFYFFIQPVKLVSYDKEIITIVLFAGLVMAMIWVPTIQQSLTFNRSFIAAFKAFFTTLLFALVIQAGVGLILLAVDGLLFTLPFSAFSHVFNIVFSLFSPLLFLSLIPQYEGKYHTLDAEQRESVRVATSISVLLERLLSYIILPLVSIYTVVVAVYIFMNIGQQFWTNDTLEYILITYIIIVVVILILMSEVEKPFVRLFVKVLPKILIPIVGLLFITSVYSASAYGITEGRYFVILFGVFAFVTSILYSFYSPKKQGWAAITFILLTMIASFPPTDVFTVSRVHHVYALEKVLKKNNMLVNNEIVPSSEISIEDQEKISQLTNYLSQKRYTKDIAWLSNNVMYFDNFEEVYGFEAFPEGDGEGVYYGQSAYLSQEEISVDITDYDIFLPISITVNQEGGNGEQPVRSFTHLGKTYKLVTEISEGEGTLVIIEEGEMLGEVNMRVVLEEALEYGEELTLKQATYTQESQDFDLKLIVYTADQYRDGYSGEFFMLLNIKK